MPACPRHRHVTIFQDQGRVPSGGRAADALAAAGTKVHLAHPLGVKAFSYRRVKNDENGRMINKDVRRAVRK